MRPMRTIVGLAVALLLATALPTGAAAADPIVPPRGGPSVSPHPSDELIVRYRVDTSPAERRGIARGLGLTTVRSSADARTQLVVGVGRSRSTVRRLLLDDPRVIAVASNDRRELADDVSAEPFFPYEWGLYNNGQTIDGERLQAGIPDIDIDGLEALRLTQGSDDIVVAVVDDGVDFSHPELADRAWTNPGEAGPLATNGIDDDGNGHVDDVHGWDFCNDDATLHDANEDGHGTHVAGTIAGSLDGSGMLGVAPGVRIMAVKFIDNSKACGQDDMAIAAIDYAASFGVPIINASWGGYTPNAVLDLAIAESHALVVAAAGNEGIDMDAGPRFYPAASSLGNVLSVAAIDQRGRLAAFSNWGARTVDVGAPGTNVLSAHPAVSGCPAPCYAWMAGTSMATPHVSGVAALVASTLGTPSASVLKSRILGRGMALASLRGRTVSGRLVNAWRSVDVTGPTALPVERHAIDVGTILGSTISTTVSWPAANDPSGVANYVLKRRIGSGGPTTLADGITARSRRSAVPIGSTVRFGVAGRDRLGNVGLTAYGPSVLAGTYQDGTSVATYAGRWSTISSSSASNGRFHRTTRAGASVEFRTVARSIGIVGRKGPANGKANVYVDGVYIRTIDLHRSSTQSRVVVFSHAWPTSGSHRVTVVAIGTAGHPGVDIDAFAVLR
jgi:subtilisin family serine protease